MIIRADQSHLHDVTELALRLWPGHESEDLFEELREIMGRRDAALFLAYEGQQPVGFAQCQLRRDYVEGTNSSPVGYLEGVYVEDDYRGKGLAGQLLRACEDWARAMGCTEFASDCELENTQSLHFHLKLGFEEANRVICFVKKL